MIGCFGLAALLLSALLHSAEAQIGTNICACQPSAYTFTLDFGLACANSTIAAALPGITDVTCNVFPDVTDPTPVSVSRIDIAEIDQNGRPMDATKIPGPFVDGNLVSYTGFVATSPENITTSSLPKGLIVILKGQNAAGVQINNSYAIVFTTNCTTYPVLTDGLQIGWTVYVSTSTIE